MKSAGTAVVVVSAAVCVLNTADAGSAWDAYLADLRDRCPSHHVEWICDGCKDDQIDGFLASLSLLERRKAETLGSAEFKQKCANVRFGFYCEEGVYLETFRKLHLLRQYAAYGCRTVTCSEPALCSKPLEQHINPR